MNRAELEDYLKFKKSYYNWMNYERFKKSLQDLEPEEYEKAIKNYCEENNL